VCTALLSAISLPLPRSTFTRFLTFHSVESVFLLLLFPNDAFYSNPNTTSITYRSSLNTPTPLLLPPMSFSPLYHTHKYIFIRFSMCVYSSQAMEKITSNIYCIILYIQIVVARKYSRGNHCYCFVVFSTLYKNFWHCKF